MIEAYLDESGIHESAAVCVIAGYFGGVGQWKKFQVLWRKTLQAAHIKPDEEFHAKDWIKSRDKKDILSSLAVAIGQYKIHPVSVAVVVADFNSYPEDVRRFFTGAGINPQTEVFLTTGSPNRPYYMALQYCIKRIAGYAPKGGKAHFKFGLHASFAGWVRELMKQIKADPIALYRDRMGTVEFPEATKTPQLQAADLFVHLTYLDMQQRLATDGWQAQPTGLLRLCLKNVSDQRDHVYFNKSAMDAMLANPEIDSER